MPYNEDLCEHKNKIEDYREGCIVCTECGLVIDDKIFSDYSGKVKSEITSNEKNEILELLHKVNLPESYSNDIVNNLKDKRKKNLPYVMYKTLNDNGCTISVKDISSITGLTNTSILDMQEKDKVIIVKPNELLEKYCKYLNLDYKSYSVIKEKISSSFQTGHNPLTIIGANIYIHCKEKKLNYSIKKIASALNISCISIQRYINKNKN